MNIIYMTIQAIAAIFLSAFPLFVFGESESYKITEKSLPEPLVESSWQLKIGEKVIDYRATAGRIVLKDEQGKEKAGIFYTAYFLKGKTPSQERPLTFCFNGGPGAGSVWLNIGALGPKCLSGSDLLSFQEPPYELIDNVDSLIEETDLVFVDPISTGLSILPPGEDPKQYYGVDEDVQLLVDFVRHFTSKFKRWDSPKYFVGESYGGMRAIKMGYKLHDEYGYYLNGIFLISPGLDFQTLLYEKSNELPYILSLPTFAAVNKYHRRGEQNLEDFLKEVENYALNRFSVGLLQGDALTLQEKKEIAKDLEKYCGVSAELIERVNLRLKSSRFAKELLRNQNCVIGTFDGRLTGLDLGTHETVSEYDCSLEASLGAMTAIYTQYLLKDLRWPEAKEYRALVPINHWNWGKGNQFASAVEDLRKWMVQNPCLRVFTAVGYFDLATPYFTTLYALNHLGPSIDKKRISFHPYQGGHMMYFNREIRSALGRDMKVFFNNSRS